MRNTIMTVLMMFRCPFDKGETRHGCRIEYGIEQYEAKQEDHESRLDLARSRLHQSHKFARVRPKVMQCGHRSASIKA